MRLAVISPFVDRRHGTERCLAEQLERFVAQPGAEIHLYAQRADDLADVVRYPGKRQGALVWHKVSRLPGPHLLGYLWWFAANRFQRWWDSTMRGLKFDLTFSPGINAFDADAIMTHVNFTEFYRRIRPHLRFAGASPFVWPLILHRHLYYRLICLLEKRIYPRKDIALATISQRSAGYARKFFGRDDVAVICYGVDTKMFQPIARLERRQPSRDSFHLRPETICLLLIGNDWKSKGLDTVLRAMADCPETPFHLLVAGSDDPRSHAEIVRALGLDSQVQFCKASPDVMQFYAAADIYVSPTREDAFALPPIEAMACGLPVITSNNNGGAQIITDGVDGFILQNPEDENEIASLLRRLARQPELCSQMGQKASQTASHHSWDRNAADTWQFLEAALESKRTVS